MSQHKFRILDGAGYSSPASNNCLAETIRVPSNSVTISVGDIFPALADALATSKAWLKDFEDDEITISYDLYEVILAYQHYQRLSA